MGVCVTHRHSVRRQTPSASYKHDRNSFRGRFYGIGSGNCRTVVRFSAGINRIFHTFFDSPPICPPANDRPWETKTSRNYAPTHWTWATYRKPATVLNSAKSWAREYAATFTRPSTKSLVGKHYVIIAVVARALTRAGALNVKSFRGKRVYFSKSKSNDFRKIFVLPGGEKFSSMNLLEICIRVDTRILVYRISKQPNDEKRF